MKNLNFVIFVDRKYVKAISLVKTKSFETIFMSTFGIYIYIYIYISALVISFLLHSNFQFHPHSKGDLISERQQKTHGFLCTNRNNMQENFFIKVY